MPDVTFASGDERATVTVAVEVADAQEGLDLNIPWAAAAAGGDDVQQALNDGYRLIFAGPGVHQPFHVAGSGQRVIGAGSNGGAGSIVEPVAGNDDYLIAVSGYRSRVEGFSVRDKGRENQIRSGVLLDQGQESLIEDILVRGFASDFSGTLDWGAPACFRLDGIRRFGDWITMRHIATSNSNGVGFAQASAMSCQVSDARLGGNRSLFILRREGALEANRSQKSVRAIFRNSHFLSGGWIGSEIDSHEGRIQFLGCQLELSSATGGGNGFDINLTNVSWLGGVLGLGAQQDWTFRFGSHAKGCVVTDYTVGAGSVVYAGNVDAQDKLE